MKKKLVRNNYAHIINQDDKTKLTICPKDRRVGILIKKLEEEMVELVDAIMEAKDFTIYGNVDKDNISDEREELIKKYRFKVTEEIADVRQVLDQITYLFNIDNESWSRKKDKYNELGGFSNYIVLEKNE